MSCSTDFRNSWINWFVYLIEWTWCYVPSQGGTVLSLLGHLVLTAVCDALGEQFCNKKGWCEYDVFTEAPYCKCSDPYYGRHCELRREPTTSSFIVITGIISGLVCLLLISFIFVCIISKCRNFRSHSEKGHQSMLLGEEHRPVSYRPAWTTDMRQLPGYHTISPPTVQFAENEFTPIENDAYTMNCRPLYWED